MSYKIKIDAFEGPLDLLLHLINRLEIDIYDIPVAEITEQYVAYIHTMKELELDIASEYLVMAASLLAIKSKMLLPKHEEEWDEDEEDFLMEDPRDELVTQLLEYKKYKEAADEFKNMEAERALLFTKPPIDLSPFTDETKLERKDLDVSLYDMLSAFQKLMRRKKLKRPLQTRITRQEITIDKRIQELKDYLKKKREKILFTSLFETDDKGQIVVTFLAVLELMRQNEIQVEQTNNFEDIFIEWKQEDFTVGYR